MNKVEVEVEKAVMGLGEGHPLFLDQTEARRAEKNFFGDRPPLPEGLDDRLPPPHYLKVWVHHWKGLPLPHPMHKL